ncbi:MAG: hypothetical protein K0S46_2196 [Moraxellaceae bacterium]|jgi:hypothetical protein|nr:hypothetical protein [Moraxellaceae bacterium]
MDNNSNPHPIFYARQHYQRLRQDRAWLDLRYEVHRDHRKALPFIGFTRHNQHTKRRMLAYFGRMDADAWWQERVRVSWLHGRICIPHPACPEAFELARWISFTDAVTITGRSADTFARWRWDTSTVPDEAAWRLLEWCVHQCCAWPRRPPRSAAPAALPAPDLQA